MRNVHVLPITAFACLVALNVAALPIAVVIESTSATALDTSQDGSSAFPSARCSLVIPPSVAFPIVSRRKTPASSPTLDDQDPVLVRRDLIKDLKDQMSEHGREEKHFRNLAEKAEKEAKNDNEQHAEYHKSKSRDYRALEFAHGKINNAYKNSIPSYEEAQKQDKLADDLTKKIKKMPVMPAIISGVSQKRIKQLKNIRNAEAVRDKYQQEAQRMRDKAAQPIRGAYEDLNTLLSPHYPPYPVPQYLGVPASVRAPTPVPDDGPAPPYSPT